MIPILNTKSTNVPAIQNGATALESNPGRRGFLIQNLGTNPLFVRFGDGGTNTVFNVVLAAGTVNDNGTGGATSQTEGIVYTGKITVASVALRYVATEFFE